MNIVLITTGGGVQDYVALARRTLSETKLVSVRNVPNRASGSCEAMLTTYRVIKFYTVAMRPHTDCLPWKGGTSGEGALALRELQHPVDRFNEESRVWRTQHGAPLFASLIPSDDLDARAKDHVSQFWSLTVVSGRELRRPMPFCHSSPSSRWISWGRCPDQFANSVLAFQQKTTRSHHCDSA